MALSFTEKQYWKNRVEKTVSGKIDELRSLSAKVIKDIRKKADCQIAEELMIGEGLTDYRNLEMGIKQLEFDQKELLELIASEVYGDEMPFRSTFADIEREIGRLVKERADSLFSQHPLGQRLESLEFQKARLLDAVLLATNVQQVGDIMDEAAALEPLPKADEAELEEEPPLLLSEYSLQVTA